MRSIALGLVVLGVTACAQTSPVSPSQTLGAAPVGLNAVTGCAVAQAPERLDTNANAGKFDVSWEARPNVDDYLLRVTRLDGTTPTVVSVVHVYPNEQAGDGKTRYFVWHPKVNGTYSFEVAVWTPCGGGPYSKPVVEGIDDVPQDQNSNVPARKYRW